MALLRIFWKPGSNQDIHLLRGQGSRDLTLGDLFFVDSSAPGAGAAPATMPAVALKFTPLFKGTQAGDIYSGFGIQVNTKTGAVTVAAAPPPLVKNNFIMEVTATEGASVFNEVIRVQIHTSVQKVWLTPAVLTVRPEGVLPSTTNYRFTVRAQFDDGVVGDITENHQVTWSGESPGDVDPNTGRLTVLAGKTPGQEVTVTATLPPAWGVPPRTATAKMRIGKKWADEPVPPTAEIIPGGGWPGIIKPDNVPNILFMGDGFTASAPDRAAFVSITTEMVQHLKTNRLMRPYDLLCTSMNFWRVSVPAQTPGISYRCEVFTQGPPGDLSAYPVPQPQKPPDTGNWEVFHLLYVVGLPVPSDFGTPRNLAAEWKQLVVTDPTPRLTPDLIDQWKQMANRCFIDEVDSFPGMALGKPPAGKFDSNMPMLDLHPDRVGRAGLSKFFPLIRDKDNVTLTGGGNLGKVWEAQSNLFRYDNSDLIVIISAYPGGRAANYLGYIALSTKTEIAPSKVTKVAGVNNLQLKPVPAPTSVETDTSRTVAHELGHSFGLNDEYVDFDQDFPGTVADLGGDANVQVLADVQSAATGQIHGDEIFWNWLRIANAGVVTGAVTPVGANFRIPVRPGDGFHFPTGKTVRLRERKEGQFLRKAKSMKFSQPLEVVTGLQLDFVVVKAAVGVPVSLADLNLFPPGSLLFEPVEVPAGIGTPADMVAINIKNHITAKRAALFPMPPGALQQRRQERIVVQVPDLEGVSLPTCFKNKPRIVGLYEGGVRYARKVYHPTGTCMMNNDHEDTAEFCAVCRYIMVDFINPAKHFEINLDYVDQYPLK